MLKIAVLDDEKKYIQIIRNITGEVMPRLGFEYELRSYTNVNIFLTDFAEKECFDICLLDVEMPQMDGLEVARRIRRECATSTIIYITNYVDYAIEAFEVNAYRYIPKCCLEEKLPEAYRALGAMYQSEHQKVYSITTAARVERIPYREIYYIKKEGKYVRIVHQRGESRVRVTLAEVLEELDGAEFLVIDRGYVVNINHVLSLKQQQILLKDGSVLPVSKPRLSQVRQEIMNYWGREACSF